MESRLETLKWLADAAKVSIAEAPVDKRAPLIREARAIASELDALTKGGGKSGDPIDEISARRAARGSAAARPGRTAGGAG